MKKPLLFGIILTVCVVIVAFVFAQVYPVEMISYWKFEDGSGTTVSDSVDANDGTLNLGIGGNINPTAAWTTGQVGGALSFDGVDDYVDAGTRVNLKFGTGAFTVEAWINANSLAGTGTATWFVARHSSNDSVGFRFGYWNRLVFRDRSSGVDVFGSTLTTGTWTHVVAVREGIGANQLKLYINGVLDAEGTSVGDFNDDSPLYIGRPGEPFVNIDYFDGKIDEVAIYNRGLSAEEIQHHYQDGLHGLGYDVECVTRPPGLVSWWPGDGDAKDIVDGNNGTEHGATYAVGRVGQAFSFDGVDDYVSLGTTQIIGDDTSFTIDAWIKVNRFADDNKQLPIYGEFSDGTRDTKNYLAVGNLQSGLEQRVFFDQFISTEGSFLKSTIQLTPGRWYHVAYTQDGTTRRLYIDGTLDNSDSAIETYAGQAPDDIRIGGGGGDRTDQRFNGLIDEVEIYNQALSADDIQAIYNAGSAGKCKEPAAIEVEINIKPGSYPNSINLCSGGATPVIIFGSENFDVTTIDPNQLMLGTATVKTVGKSGRFLCSIEDIGSPDPTWFDSLGGPDGWDDLICHFITVDMDDLNDNSTTTATVTIIGCDNPSSDGCTDGDPGYYEIFATDSVKIVKDCDRP